MFDLEKIVQRIQSMITRGRITYVDDSGVVQKVQVKMNADDIPDERYRVPEFGLSSNPPIGSDAILVHVAGDRSSGVVIGTNHQISRPTGLQPGETQIYSEDGKSVYLTASGGIVVEAKGQAVTVNDATVVVINAASKVRMVTPRFECTGDIVDHCDTTGSSMATMRTEYDAHGHPVVNVQTGGSTITTGTPNVVE